MVYLPDEFPFLETERLELKPISDAHAQDLFDMRADPETMQFINRPLAKSVHDAAALIAVINEGWHHRSSITWGIFLKGSTTLVGTIGYWRIEAENLRAEIGYLLHKNLQNQGYMSEALACVIAFGFNNMLLHSIEANCNPLNIRSVNLLLKHHFIQEAYFKENMLVNGKFEDTVILSRIHSNSIS
jgi:ribosomal-protein-alanine N-acetyltransferase